MLAPTLDLPDCCAIPMMLAPVGWVCWRDAAHRRAFRWTKPDSRALSVEEEAGRA